MTRAELEAMAEYYSESAFLSGRLDIEHGVVGTDFYKIYEAAFKAGFLAGRDSSLKIYEKAFENNWTVQDTLDTIKALGEDK